MILLWVYCSALILFFGAEFTEVYASAFGAGAVPADNAAPLRASGSRSRCLLRCALRYGQELGGFVSRYEIDVARSSRR
jgi:hypothetical protein